LKAINNIKSLYGKKGIKITLYGKMSYLTGKEIQTEYKDEMRECQNK
jgi:hypothetical protein